MLFVTLLLGVVYTMAYLYCYGIVAIFSLCWLQGPIHYLMAGEHNTPTGHTTKTWVCADIATVLLSMGFYTMFHLGAMYSYTAEEWDDKGLNVVVFGIISSAAYCGLVVTLRAVAKGLLYCICPEDTDDLEKNTVRANHTQTSCS
ncbi:hypothetical protein LTR56_000023 [Elasticomyces elasticus]|nr:hypothetical protein LTR22_016374 [Elasticomyces elasticus]KAK3661537.1 hypothetical protein LTR56_000023 [Elasticomyces elasticus]KAK4932788.1 hypothetical protein LTR49_000742 [Elasticomyces elasticus]KAK5758233.1 hypothetical protein LTS12_011703 [Elasticomyces elasticus]